MPRQNNLNFDKTNSVVNMLSLLGPNSKLSQDIEAINPVGWNPTVGTVFEDLNTSTNVDWVPPTTTGTLSIVSTSGNDASGNTGINVILLSGLDGDYNPQTESLLMTGLTPVVSSLEWIALNAIIFPSIGTNKSSVGVITITNTDDAVVWATILAGETNYFNGIYTIRSGFSFIINKATVVTGLGGDFELEALVNFLGGTTFNRLTFSLSHEYGTSYYIAPSRLGEKSTIKMRARRETGGGGGTKLYTYLSGFLIRNSYFDNLLN